MNDAISPPPAFGRPNLYDGFRSEVVAGLSQSPKTLPCKFLYDEEGSKLFSEICELDEYYPTRTENEILRDNIGEIAGLIGSRCRLVEFGSGSSAKTRHLLAHLPHMSAYIPIDISGQQLLKSVIHLSREFPGLEISPLEADYHETLEIPDTKQKPLRTVAFFPGSTIGNFDPLAAIDFLRRIAFLCGSEGGLLIGVDRQKPRRILESAYNDHKGVTAKFNLGVLARANRELGTDFDLSAFCHHAPFNEIESRIEMRLVSKRAQIVHLDFHQFRFEEGEYITTEHSYKYTLPGFAGLASRAGFELVKNWEDPDHLFSVIFLRVKPRKPAQIRISLSRNGTTDKTCRAC